jgi:GNAT superfamily N-acetyltransferase
MQLCGNKLTDMTQALQSVRLEIVRAWVDGWVVSRNAPLPVPEPWGLRVDVGLPGHVTRHVLPAPTPDDLRLLTETISAPGTWLKLCAPAEAVVPWLTPAWSVDGPEFMMTGQLTRGRVTAPDGYTLAVTTRSEVTVARLLSAAGEIAARGQIAVTGRTAVVDQVETAPNHRRRGLGSVVMRALADVAASRGARTGILVATPAGQALYQSIGWTTRTPMTAAVLT